MIVNSLLWTFTSFRNENLTRPMIYRLDTQDIIYSYTKVEKSVKKVC